MKGLLLKESLKDSGVLALVQVTKTEFWQVSNAVAGQPATWTALSFEAEDNQADTIAKTLSQTLKESWYINASTDIYVYVIFPDKVFKYLKGDRLKREEAKSYGRLINIPESQLDWSE